MVDAILRLLGANADEPRYREGKQARTFAAGSRLVTIGGRRHLTRPVTDEPIRTGGRVTVMTEGRKSILLGARK